MEKREQAEIIRNFAKLELEREDKETQRQLTEMDEQQLAEVFAATILEQMKLQVELERIGQSYDSLEIMYEHLRKVYMDKYGLDINQMTIEFNPEEQTDEL